MGGARQISQCVWEGCAREKLQYLLGAAYTALNSASIQFHLYSALNSACTRFHFFSALNSVRTRFHLNTALNSVRTRFHLYSAVNSACTPFHLITALNSVRTRFHLYTALNSVRTRFHLYSALNSACTRFHLYTALNGVRTQFHLYNCIAMYGVLSILIICIAVYGVLLHGRNFLGKAQASFACSCQAMLDASFRCLELDVSCSSLSSGIALHSYQTRHFSQFRVHVIDRPKTKLQCDTSLSCIMTCLISSGLASANATLVINQKNQVSKDI